jgi:sulfite reductase (ferredoxin)
MPGYFALYVGGDFEGTRLNWRLLDRVPENDVAETLAPLFAEFAKVRNTGEGFGDFVHRLGLERVTALVSKDAVSKDGSGQAPAKAERKLVEAV